MRCRPTREDAVFIPFGRLKIVQVVVPKVRIRPRESKFKLSNINLSEPSSPKTPAEQFFERLGIGETTQCE